MQELRDLCNVKDLVAAIVQLEAGLRKETGLNLNQAFALCCLAKGSLNAGALAEELRIHGASLSRIIKALTLRGYIDSKLDPEDSRQRFLSLTDKGYRKALILAEYEKGAFPVLVDMRQLA